MMCAQRFILTRDYSRQICWLLLLGCMPCLRCQSASVITPPTAVVTHSSNRERRFSACQKLNPVWWFGNADDPIAPDWYRHGERRRNAGWHLRNPCHNFTFYVIGIADQEYTRVGRHASAVFNPHKGWNWAVCRYKCLRLPFLSYHRGGFKFYCGWRNAGNFGMKLSLAKKKKVPPHKPEN
jgi:hypothetical protein